MRLGPAAAQGLSETLAAAAPAHTISPVTRTSTSTGISHQSQSAYSICELDLMSVRTNETQRDATAKIFGVPQHFCARLLCFQLPISCFQF